ncbi:MAG: alpha/beta fold hydrolase [Pseudomonadota bacterium]
MTGNKQTPTKTSLTILIPGLNGSGLELGQLPRFLEQNGHDVLVPDVDGFLFGTPADNFHTWLSQLHFLIDSMTGKYESIHLGGISMGATLAIAVASQRSDIGSIILMSPVLRYDGWSVPWYRPLLDFFYLLGAKSWKYSERPPYGVKNSDLRRRIAEKFKAADISEVGAASITARHLHEAKGLMSYAKSHLDLISNRVLIIQSVEDDTCSIWSAQEILHNISSELRRVIWLGNSYHIITIDNEREIVLNECLRFLDRANAIDTGMEHYYSTHKPKLLKARHHDRIDLA